MLGKIWIVRHAIVGAAIVGTTLLAAFGVIGAGSHEERFDAKTIVVEPRSDDTIRITEYVDQDFGIRQTRLRALDPERLRVPTDVVASSPDAPDDLSVVDEGNITRIRIGDPDTTIKNQHRYVLSYTYPDTMLSELGLLLDIVAPAGDGWVGDNETGRFEIVVKASSSPTPAATSAPGSDRRLHTRSRSRHRAAAVSRRVRTASRTRGCVDPGRHRGVHRADPIPVPDLPDRRPDHRWRVALAMIPVGLLVRSCVPMGASNGSQRSVRRRCR